MNAARYQGDIGVSITSENPITEGDALRELVNRTIQQENRSIKRRTGHDDADIFLHIRRWKSCNSKT